MRSYYVEITSLFPNSIILYPSSWIYRFFQNVRKPPKIIKKVKVIANYGENVYNKSHNTAEHWTSNDWLFWKRENETTVLYYQSRPWMNVWMTEWMNEWINQSINQSMNHWMNQWINECIMTQGANNKNNKIIKKTLCIHFYRHIRSWYTFTEHKINIYFGILLLFVLKFHYIDITRLILISVESFAMQPIFIIYIYMQHAKTQNYRKQ